MALLRYFTYRFGLSPAWLVVVVVSPLSLMSSYRVALLLVVLCQLFLLLVSPVMATFMYQYGPLPNLLYTSTAVVAHQPKKKGFAIVLE